MSNVLFILNDPPSGTERRYNGFRLTAALAKRDTTQVRIYLMGDGGTAGWCNSTDVAAAEPPSLSMRPLGVNHSA